MRRSLRTVTVLEEESLSIFACTVPLAYPVSGKTKGQDYNISPIFRNACEAMRFIWMPVVSAALHDDGQRQRRENDWSLFCVCLRKTFP